MGYFAVPGLSHIPTNMSEMIVDHYRNLGRIGKKNKPSRFSWFGGRTVPDDFACLLSFIVISPQNLGRTENRKIQCLVWNFLDISDVAQLIGRCRILCKIRKPSHKKGWGWDGKASPSVKSSTSWATFSFFLLSYRVSLGKKVKNFPAKHAHTHHRRTDVSSARAVPVFFSFCIFMHSNRKAF